jgi:hypothetical protein
MSQLVMPQVLSDGSIVWWLFHTLQELMNYIHFMTEVKKEFVLPFFMLPEYLENNKMRMFLKY